MIRVQKQIIYHLKFEIRSQFISHPTDKAVPQLTSALLSSASERPSQDHQARLIERATRLKSLHSFLVLLACSVSSTPCRRVCASTRDRIPGFHYSFCAVGGHEILQTPFRK